MDERVQKVLSRWGMASRRQAEQMILQGRVWINGNVAHLGQKIDSAVDRVVVDGVVVKPADYPERIYLLMNKPVGVVCTCSDPWNHRTVLELLPTELGKRQGIHPVGRLDAESTGALLLTNDGDLTFYLTHPRHHIPKTYRVWIDGHPSEQILKRWRQGVMLDDRKTLPAEVLVVERHPDHKTLLEVVLKEGRNRQIRRVAEQLGHPVLQLHRTAIGSIQLQTANAPMLPSGSYRVLTEVEIDFLNSQVDLTSKRRPVKDEECSI
ncbi:MAG: rRNA pseudouridine synthase [Leptolyngbyaceae cyanobacterium RU_5_1]|nr:rRNA pseudouridine synthase [Leptolyngbyaceae cyanobacterium RU_5_1]